MPALDPPECPEIDALQYPLHCVFRRPEIAINTTKDDKHSMDSNDRNM